MNYDIIKIIEELGFNTNEVKKYVINVDNKNYTINFNDDGIANEILDRGIDSCADIGIKVLVNNKQIGWF